MKMRIKYHTENIEKLEYIDGKSDWIDLRSGKDYSLKKGDFQLIDLGVSVEIPKGYEMLIVPRSSLFKNYGLIQTNGIGIIDESYCSDDDHLMLPVYAFRDVEIKTNDRLCQFRILKHQPEIEFDEVESLGNSARGGFGSTGKQ